MMMHKRTRRRSARRAGAGQRYLVPSRAGGPFGAMMDEQLMLTFLDTHGPTLLAVGGALGGVWTVARFGLALLRDLGAWLVDRAAGR